MAQLTKGMYGREFEPKGGPFELYYGQMRGGETRMTHNSGWYNKLGENLGFGDLSVVDIRRIARGLKKDEFFIILSETDSKWRFEYSINGQPKVDLPEDAPGVDYVSQNAMYVIARKDFYFVDRYYGAIKEKVYTISGLNFKVIGVDALKALIAVV